MSHTSWLRQLQDRQQNEGWRIAMIPYAPSGKPATIHNTPLSLTLLGLGLLMFIGGVIAAIAVHPWALLACPLGLAVMLSGRAIAQWQLTRNWVSITAHCRDIEIRKARTIKPVIGHNGRRTHEDVDVWVFRLLCEFTLNGEHYQVTPSTPPGFRTEAALQTYVDQHVVSQPCVLWVNPTNPRQCSLGKPPRL